MTRRCITQGQIWVTRKPATRTQSRRIVAILNGRIFYSAGGGLTHSCGRAAFIAWIRRYDSRLTRRHRPHAITLRSGRAA